MITQDAHSLAERCWEWLCQKIRNHQESRERPFALALAGGSTPRQLYALAGQRWQSSRIDADRMVLLLGDERNVPPDHPESNFRMVSETLLRQISIPQQNVLAVPGAGGDPHAAASNYERLLAERLGVDGQNRPLIDCILLGLGEDVHTASLFPETQAIAECRRSVVANYVPKLNAWRITLTLPAINAAPNIAFLIAGRSKQGALKNLWHGPRDGNRYPAQLVRPVMGQLVYFVDRDALGATPLVPGSDRP